MVDYGYVRDPDWLVPLCPRCDRLMLSRSEYVVDEEGNGRGYLLLLVCLGADDPEAPCDYRRVL